MPDYQPQYANSYALVIGINTYRNPAFQPLGNAEEDARAFADLLAAPPLDFKVQTLLGSRATKQAILAALYDLRQTNPDDRIIVYFAGHGYSLKNKLGFETGYLAAVDTEPQRDYTAIELDEVIDLRLKAPAKHVSFVFDACYSGQVLGITRAAAERAPAASLLTRAAYQAISAATGDQTAGDARSMTDVLIDAIRSLPPGPDGLMTLNEVATFVQQEVNRRSKGAQLPQFGHLTGSQGGDFIFYQTEVSEEGTPATPPSFERPAPAAPQFSIPYPPVVIGAAILVVAILIAIIVAVSSGGGGNGEVAEITPTRPDEIGVVDVTRTALAGGAEPGGVTDAATPTAEATEQPPGGPPLGKIVYTCYDGSIDHVCLINADGSGQRQLTSGSATEYFASISPDGTRIAFSSRRGGAFDIYVMDSDGGNQTRLTSGQGSNFSPDISPDGTRIAFTSTAGGGQQHIWVMNADGTGLQQLTSGPGDEFDPAWSPDGTQILYAAQIGARHFEQFVMNADGTNPLQLTFNQFVGGRADWSPDGRTIAFFAGEGDERDIYLMDVDGSNIRQVTSGGDNRSPSFSPDGAWIVFASLADGDNEIVIIRVDGTDRTQLTFNTLADWQPRWGP